MIGETLGSYKVLAKIGEGGMGAIYLAEQPLIGRRVAVKVLLPEMSTNPSALQRFFNEARTTARLRHPSLVDVFDFGVHKPSGRAYIIMELLEGENLARVLHRVGRLSIPDAVDFAQQICHAVAIAHRAGIVHRDLKPDNAFLVPDPWQPNHRLVKILDFGIAKLTAPGAGVRTTGTGNVVGTPLYMSPEQCRGIATIDARADIYSIGCMLYAMVCGRPPFQYEGFGEIIIAQVSEEPPPPHTKEPSIPAELEAIILKALAKDPGRRQQTTTELAAELARVPIDGLGRTLVLPPDPSVPYVSATPPPNSNTTLSASVPPPSALRTAGGRRGIVLGAASAVAVVGVGLLLTVRGPSRSGKTIAVEVEKRQPAAVVNAPPVTQPVVEVERPPIEKIEIPPAPAPAATGRPRAERRPRPRPRPAEQAPELVEIAITNAREGLVVFVDGRHTRLPLRLPRDGKPHRVLFRTPNFHAEVRTLTADEDQTITLANRPAFITE